MAKFLLPLLMAVLVSRSGRAEGVAGEPPLEFGFPPIRKPEPGMLFCKPEPDIVSRTMEHVRKIALRLKGVWLGSLVQKGMTFEQVVEILGYPDGFDGGVSRMCCFYRELGISVDFTVKWEKDIIFDRVINVRTR